MIDKEKFKNIEDPEIKALMERMSEFAYPRFEELQDLLSGNEKPNFLKMMKIAKDFSKKLKTDYKAKYSTDMESDIKKINEYIGINANPDDLINMFKNM